MRVAISLDDERTRGMFAGRLHRDDVPIFPSGDAELRRLAVGGALDVAVVGVLGHDDVLWPDALREIAEAVPEVGLVGVIEPLRASLDEAVALSREIPALGFVSRPDTRFDHLARRRAARAPAPGFTLPLLDCVDSLPLADVGRDFALLQALRPSWAFNIPEQAADLGASRRKLERWFQGPDLCSARRLQSICAAAEALYLRRVRKLRDGEIAGALGILTRDGIPNPIGVSREIRAVFGRRDLIPEGGMDVVTEAVQIELRRAHDADIAPARWGPFTRYWPAMRVLAVPHDDRLVLIEPSRELEYPLDDFGEDAWDLVGKGATFSELTTNLAARRHEPRNRIRGRLREWLGELLVLGLVRREQGESSAAEHA
jgi:hypothetical protein